MPNYFTLTQRNFEYCHICPFFNVLRQNVIRPPFSKRSPFPHGISLLIAVSFNNNIVICQSFTCIFNCNFITSHLLVVIHKLSTTIKQRRFGLFVHHHQCRAFISLTWMHLQIVSNASTIFHKHKIFIFYDFLYFQTHMSIRLHTFTITKKRTFYSFCIKLASLLVRNHS